MQRPTSYFALVATMLMAVAPALGYTQDLPDNHSLSTAIMQCRVKPDTVIRTLPRTLFGTNLEWFNYADGISSSDGSVAGKWSSLAQAQGINHVRFPGGTLSDFYHWRDGIGPLNARPMRDHPTDSGRSPNVFGTPELLKWCSKIGAKPLITVNAGTGTADEAAAWVAYCNSTQSPERTADGLPRPANVSLWEIGNELYLPGNPTDKQIITVDPSVYADQFLSFAAAMRAVDPGIKLMAIGTANATDVALPYPDWNDVVLPKVAAVADYYSVHNAYFPMTFGYTNLPWKDVYQSLWAAPDAVDRSLTALDAKITTVENGRRIEIAITEWGALFSWDPALVDHVKTMGTSVYLARLVQVFMGQPRVAIASYFKFTDGSFMGWVGYDARPKIPYYVIQMFSQHFGTRLIASTIESPEYSVKAVGVLAAQDQVPELTVASSLNDTGTTLFVNIVNRSWNTVHQVQIDPGSFPAGDSVKTWTLTTPGLTDNNGPDMPPGTPASIYTEPPVNAAFKPPATIQLGSASLSRPILIQPYSIVTVEIGQTTAPSITTQPATISVAAGNNASFSVTASGNPTPNLQWPREASGGSTWSNLSNGGSYSGSATGTLTVSSTTIAMSHDQFRCVAANAVGSAISNAATLTVNAAPTPNPTPTPTPAHRGGGGAPSIWFLLTLGALATLRSVHCFILRRLLSLAQ